MTRLQVRRPIGTTTDDRGFTMVELMISLTVMTVGVLGAIGVFNSSFAVAGQANIRSKAVALATRSIEAVRAVPYEKLAISATATTRTETVDNTTFTVVQAITSADAAGVTGALKRATVSVSWTDHGGTHVVDQHTFVYPGGLGPHQSTASTTSTSAPTGVPLPPHPVVAASPPNAPDAVSAVDLSWTAMDTTNLSGFVVRYTTGATTVTVTDTLPAVARDLRVVGLSASTTYTFQVAGRSATGAVSSWTSSQPVTTASPAGGDCVIGTPAIDPARVAKPAGEAGPLSVNPVFSVNTSGSCTGLRVEFAPTKHGATLTRPLDGASGLRTRSLDEASVSWDPGVHFVDLYDGNGAKRATVKLTVCESSKSCK